jgi:hypothetical protein
MKNLLLSGIVFLFGTSAGAWAGEYWIPGTREGSQVEFVTLEFGQHVLDNTGGAFDSKIELGLTEHTLVFSLQFFKGGQEEARSLALYQSLLDARSSSAYVNILVEEGTLAIKGVRFGTTDHSLALDETKAGAERAPAAGNYRFDLLGRKLLSGPSKPKADAKVPFRAIVSR